MEMYAAMGKIVIVFMSLFGFVSALKCLKCEWSLQNTTIDDICLGAPYKVDSIDCEGTSPGELFVCQTKATFSEKAGVKNLESLERTCGPKHADCDNTCAEHTEVCWQCCKDTSNCNGFPLRVNAVLTTSSSAPRADVLFKTFVVIFVFLRTI